MRKILNLFLFCVVCFTLGLMSNCGDSDIPSIDLSNFNPVLFIDNVPVYSNLTKEEINVISSIHKAFKDKYNLQAKGNISGIFVAHSIEEPIPCISSIREENCTWNNQFPTFLGYAIDYFPRDNKPDFIFAINPYGDTIMLLDMIYLHECGHTYLNMKHDNEKQQEDYSNWETEMQKYRFKHYTNIQ